jgi:hypothetical protein
MTSQTAPHLGLATRNESRFPQSIVARRILRHEKAPRSFRYVCAAHHYRGQAICANGLEMCLEVADDAVLDLIEGDLLRPSVINQAVRLALDALLADRPEDRRPGLLRQRASLDAKLAQLTAAVESGGHFPSLLDARERERAQIQAEFEALDRERCWHPRNRRTFERELLTRLADWRALLRSQTAKPGRSSIRCSRSDCCSRRRRMRAVRPVIASRRGSHSAESLRI